MLSKHKIDVPLKIKSISETGEFEGYGSVFGVKDCYSDIVIPGAFEKSLSNWNEKKRLPAMLWQHKVSEPIGLYTEMKEDGDGLYIKGRLLVDDDPLAKRAYAHLKAGSLTGLSIGYELIDYSWDKEKEGWILKEIDLWEVSLVTFPANDVARVSDVKAALKGGGLPSPVQVERCLRDVGFSHSQAKALMAKGMGALRDAGEGCDLQTVKNALLNSIKF